MLSIFRSEQNPFLAPVRARAFEALGTCNPSVVIKDGMQHVFYRAMAAPDDVRTPGRAFSTIAYTTSNNGDIYGDRQQILGATESWDFYGLEDPRATFFEGKWYVFYTALGGFPFAAENIKVAVAVGDSPDSLTEKHLVTPFNAKAATLFPSRIGGDAVLLLTLHTDYTPDHPRPTIALARAKNVEDFWDPTFWESWYANYDAHAFPDVRRVDTEHMEVGATPILTEQGWLVLYSHIQNYYDEPHRVFGVEALLLDANDPQKVLGKTEFPILVPEESYERYGLVSNIVFPTGACVSGDTVHLYYGAADTFCAKATFSLSHLLSSLVQDSRSSFMTRAPGGPNITPDPTHDWESQYTFNAAAIDLEGSVHLLYRAMGSDGISRLGYARSTDGITIDERLPDAVYAPRTPEERGGTEDPRLTLIGDTLYLAYTAYDGTIARGALSTISVKDFVAHNFNWSSPTLITPPHQNNKDIAIFPERVGTHAAVIHRIDPNICIDFSEAFPPEGVITQSIDLMSPRVGMWDYVKIGIAGTPIRVPEGWLCIYHGVGGDYTYRLGAALIDAETATTVLARTALPILEPEMEWEKTGQVHNVVFSCGAVLRGDTLLVYYGGGDTSTGVATVSLRELMNRLTKPS